MRIRNWLSLIVLGAIALNSAQGMIVRNKGEQTIAIQNAAPFSSVGIVGNLVPISEKDIHTFTELFKSIKTSPLEEQKKLVQLAFTKMFSELIYQRILEIVQLNKMDIITFLDHLILKEGVKVKGKVYQLPEFLKLLYQMYSLGLSSFGTGTVIDPKSIGLDEKKYHNRVIFTAAHVVYDKKGSYVFRLSPHKDNPNLAEYREYKVRHILMPKEYTQNNGDNANLSGHDFAVLILDKAIDLPIIHIKVKLMDLKDLLGRTVLSVGFGRTGYVGSDMINDFIRRAGHYLINYVNPKTLVFGAATLVSPQNFLYGANPFNHSQLFLGHPFKGQGEFTPFDYQTSLLKEVANLYQNPAIRANITTINQSIHQWQTQPPRTDLQEVNITYRYGPYKDQIIKYAKLPDVPVMVLQGDSGGPVMICENGLYYMVGVTFAGSGTYGNDKEVATKPEEKYCKKPGCGWASSYEKEELSKILPAMKNKNYTGSFVNHMSHLLPRLRQALTTVSPSAPKLVRF